MDSSIPLNGCNCNKEEQYPSSWTKTQDEQFENALALYDEDSPDRWKNIAKAVDGKSEEDVKIHYQLLVEDVNNIECGHVPIPDYDDSESTDNSSCIDVLR